MLRKKQASTNRPVGETFVWVTSLGLTIGLTMVALLLTLILVDGLAVFWPERVVQIELKKGSRSGIGGSAYLGGRIVKEQKSMTTSEPEWQLFLGNKDIYGLSFKFVDVKEIAKVTYPKDIMELERMEYGNAICYPKSLEVHGEGTIPYADHRFAARMEELVREVNSRRKKIQDLEKKRIGAINHDMEELRVRQKGLSDQTRLQEIQKKIDELQAQYEVLAMEASQLRAMQEGHFLNYTLISGEEKRLPLGQVVHYYFPNQLSMLDRAGLFLRNIRHFVSDEPREANTEGGIFPAIFGTFVMTLLLSVAVTPFGVLAAIYLREYAKQGFFVRSVRIAVNNLAGVPSIVFGVFGLGFFVYLLGGTIDRLFFSAYLPTPTFGTGGILWASLTLALMTVPVVIVATEEALAAVPRGMREGSLACGASKWQTIQRIVLPASAPGILTGLILAMARGAGEVAPLMLVGVVKLAPSLPIDSTYPYIHLDQKFMHLGFHIYDLGFQSPDSEAAKPMVFSTTLFLILLVVLLNLGALIIRERLRKRYSTGAF